jgi:hypothetical protein
MWLIRVFKAVKIKDLGKYPPWIEIRGLNNRVRVDLTAARG